MWNKYLKWIVVIVFIIINIKVVSYFSNRKVEALQRELRAEIIKHDELKKINKTLYTKLVADTLTKRQLNKIIDSLELQVKNPKIVTEIVFVPVEVTKPIDGIVVKDSTLSINTYYPSKEDPFVNYKSKINLKTNKGEETFSFTPISIALGIGQNKDGTFSLNTKVPEFIKVLKIDVQALPMTPVKKDNFGWLIGGGIGTDFVGGEYYNGSFGVRINKVYIEVEAATNKTLEGKIKFEF